MMSGIVVQNGSNFGKKKNGVTDSGVVGKVFDYTGTVLFFIVSFLLWEAAVRLFEVPQYILVPPSAVFKQMTTNYAELYRHTIVTAAETFIGYGIAVVFAVPIAIATAFSKFLRQTFYPMAVTLEMVPKIAFAPLFVIWFGFGFSSKMVVVFLVCFFPILINGIFGFASISTELLYLSRSTGAGVLRTFFKMRLPFATPQLFVGFKGAAVNATIGATIAEWIGGNAGLGYFINIMTGLFRMDKSIAAIIILTGLGLVIYGIVVLLEKRLIPWHISQRNKPLMAHKP